MVNNATKWRGPMACGSQGAPRGQARVCHWRSRRPARLGSCLRVRLCLLILTALAFPAGMLAQDTPISSSSIGIDLGKDSPVVLVGSKTGESRATSLGPGLLIDLHMSLLLRNTSAKRIRSLKLGVVAQEGAGGCRACVAQPGTS